MTAHRRVALLMMGMRRDGGAEALVRTLLEELQGSDYEFDIISLKTVRPEDRPVIEQLGANLADFPSGRLVSPRRFVRLLRTLRRGRYDVLHTHLVAPTIFGLLCGMLLRVPVVVTLHNTETKADRHLFHGRLERLLIRRFAARVIAVGDRTAKARSKVLGDDVHIHVLPNAVSPTEPLSAGARAELRRSIMANPSARLIFAAARLEEQKAHEDLIAAVKLLRAHVPDAELAIAGRGSKRAMLEKLIADEGLVGVVHLLGSRADVRPLMRACDVFAMSSRWEGLPVALLEAMEAGAPIVATRVGDIPAVLGADIGTMVESGDVPALARAIEETLDAVDRGADLISKGQAAVDEQYSSARWAQRICDHYEAVLVDR